MDTPHYGQSKCWEALKVHANRIREDQQHWSWHPGGQLFIKLLEGDLLIVLNNASGPVRSPHM